MKFSTVILAAGKGTRMRSTLPKVMHKIAGKPMVKHVIDTCCKLGADSIRLVYGFGAEVLKTNLASEPVDWVLQSEQLGTGHAVNCASSLISDDEKVLILYGDCPLISAQTLNNLLKSQPEGGIALLTVLLDDPTGYGRIIRLASDDGTLTDNSPVIAIVEQKDATQAQQQINEVNTGVMVADGADLKRWLSQLGNDNSQGEYYLTDVIGMAHNEGRLIKAIHPRDNFEVEGVNDKVQLAKLERVYQTALAERLLADGLMIRDPLRFDLRGELTFGQDCEVDINVIIEGKVKLGNNVQIGAGVLLKECNIADNSVIEPYSVIDQSQVGANCKLGPFARLRPGSTMADNSHVGNFVELKNTYLGEGSKANHLTYLGDTEVGCATNIGAGLITCNYDGVNKSKTIIGDNVFVGSGTQLIAPIEIADGVTIGAGSTLSHDVAKDRLVLTRAKVKSIDNWPKPVKKS